MTDLDLIVEPFHMNNSQNVNFENGKPSPIATSNTAPGAG